MPTDLIEVLCPRVENCVGLGAFVYLALPAVDALNSWNDVGAGRQALLDQVAAVLGEPVGVWGGDGDVNEARAVRWEDRPS